MNLSQVTFATFMGTAYVLYAEWQRSLTVLKMKYSEVSVNYEIVIIEKYIICHCFV